MGLRLKECRLNKNLTQQEVGKKINKSHAMICYLERGRRGARPDIVVFLKLAEIYDEEIDYLLTGKRSKLSTNSVGNSVNKANTVDRVRFS